jgi:hydroxymethylglutaryl-CoA reductase (NADPH)
MLLTRGRRVVAEATVSKDLLKLYTGADVGELFRFRQIHNAGSFLAGSASVAESHAAITYSQLLENGDFYWSITLPSLIVATGGGTGLATQRQWLEMMDCYGAGKAHKLAEICAAVVLAGEISLASAVLCGDWVTAHERLGRNRK